MATMSLTLSKELEQRSCKAAAELGISTHAFMVDAIRQATDMVEQHTESVTQGQAVRAGMIGSGQGHDAAVVRAYLRARLADPAALRPATKPWRE